MLAKKFNNTQLSKTAVFDIFSHLEALRYCEIKNAERAIRRKDYYSLGNHEFLFTEINALLSKHFGDDASAEFPVWPNEVAVEEDMPVVVFSDGSTVETADVPF